MGQTLSSKGESFIGGQNCCGRCSGLNKHSYSVWLIPERGALQERLDSLVKQTSWEFSGPCFDFHVTLVDGVERNNLGMLKDEIELLAKTMQSFEVLFRAKNLTFY